MTHDCEGCRFFNPWLNVCEDEVVFVYKDTGKRSWCRYEEGVTTLSDYLSMSNLEENARLLVEWMDGQRGAKV